MMALEAPRLNLDMKFIDDMGEACPAAQVCGATSGSSGGKRENRVVQGKLYEEEKLRELAAGCHVVTMEIEHVGVEGLAKLEEEGVNVQPSSRVVGIIQDKFVQKVREVLCVHFVVKSLPFSVTAIFIFFHHLILNCSTLLFYVVNKHFDFDTGILLQSQHSPSTLRKPPQCRGYP